MSVNKVILVGHVGNDPEVKHLDAGTQVANFRLATSESYKNRDGERVVQTEWHYVVAWRGLAEIVEKYVKKGQQLYIEGRIRTRAWDDKDGNKRYTTEILADNMQMLGKRSESDTMADNPNAGQTFSKNQQEVNSSAPLSVEEPDDDLPF